MSETIENVYATPESEVAATETITGNHYFCVTTTKLAFMSIISGGIYLTYWFYKNWKLVQLHDAPAIRPVVRAFFAGFTSFYLFKRVKNTANEMDIETQFNGNAMAAGFLLVNFAGRLPDPFWLVSFLSFLFIHPVNQAIIKINTEANTNFQNNGSYTGWNWFFIIGGALAWLMVIAAYAVEAI